MNLNFFKKTVLLTLLLYSFSNSHLFVIERNDALDENNFAHQRRFFKKDLQEEMLQTIMLANMLIDLEDGLSIRRHKQVHKLFNRFVRMFENCLFERPCSNSNSHARRRNNNQQRMFLIDINNNDYNNAFSRRNNSFEFNAADHNREFDAQREFKKKQAQQNNVITDSKSFLLKNIDKNKSQFKQFIQDQKLQQDLKDHIVKEIQDSPDAWLYNVSLGLDNEKQNSIDNFFTNMNELYGKEGVRWGQIIAQQGANNIEGMKQFNINLGNHILKAFGSVENQKHDVIVNNHNDDKKERDDMSALFEGLSDEEIAYNLAYFSDN